MKRNKDSLWDNIKTHQHLCYRGLRRRREKGPKKIFKESVAENLTKM